MRKRGFVKVYSSNVTELTPDQLDAVNRIKAQIMCGYIDLGTHDAFDIKLIDEAIAALEKLKTVPDACRHCPNHPTNGGSGICFCILGQQVVSY